MSLCGIEVWQVWQQKPTLGVAELAAEIET